MAWQTEGVWSPGVGREVLEPTRVGFKKEFKPLHVEPVVKSPNASQVV